MKTVYEVTFETSTSTRPVTQNRRSDCENLKFAKFRFISKKFLSTEFCYFINSVPTAPLSSPILGRYYKNVWSYVKQRLLQFPFLTHKNRFMH